MGRALQEGWAHVAAAGAGHKNGNRTSPTREPTRTQGTALPVATQLSDLEVAEDEDVWLTHLWASTWSQACTGSIQHPLYRVTAEMGAERCGPDRIVRTCKAGPGRPAPHEMGG